MQFLIDIGLSMLYFTIFLLFCAWSWRFWMMYKNQNHLNSINWVMLEIKLPKDIDKSPLASEMALTCLLQGGGISHKYARLFNGALPVYSSLEIASIEGVIHFYIRIQKKYRPLIESNFYAQYPGIEIIEADDYTSKIKYDHLSKDVSLWGGSFKINKNWTPTNEKTGEPYKKDGKDLKMPADFLPIKTYVDYGLDKNPKEEHKVDPLAPLLEMMGGLGKGEYFWYQILVQDESVYNGNKMPKFYVNEDSHEHLSLKDLADKRKKQIRTASWVKEGGEVIDEFGVPKIIESFDEKYNQLFDEEKDKDGKIIKKPKKKIAKYLKTKAISKKEMDLTPEEKDEIEAINKKLSKPLALCVMRCLYIAKKENFSTSNIQNVLSFVKPFSGFNTFGPKNLSDPYDFPWENFRGRRSPWRAEEVFEAYVEREGFFPHIQGRKSLDSWEDDFFWALSMKHRKLFRMIFEAVVYPFNHPDTEEAFTLNMEELATLWHLPGSTVATPTLPRVGSTKGVAPVNLPI